MDLLEGVRTINIEYIDLTEILSGVTGNVLAETEIPEMLREAIRRDVLVKVSDPIAGIAYRLRHRDGHFEFLPLEGV